MFDRLKNVTALLFLALLILAACRTAPELVETSGEIQRVSVSGVEMSVAIPDLEVSTNEMFHLTLKVRHNSTYQVELPDVSEKLGSFFVFEHHDTRPRLNGDGWVEMTRVYTLEPDLPGEAVIPELRLSLKNDQGESSELATKPIAVLVRSVLTGQGELLREIAPDDQHEAETPVSRWHLWRWVLFIFNVLVVCFFALLWRKWKKGKDDSEDVSSYKKFKALESASSSEIIQNLEPCVVRVIARNQRVKLDSVDFAGLAAKLQSQDGTLSGLDDAMEHYNQLIYAREAPSDIEVLDLYGEFSQIIEVMLGVGGMGGGERKGGAL